MDRSFRSFPVKFDQELISDGIYFQNVLEKCLLEVFALVL